MASNTAVGTAAFAAMAQRLGLTAVQRKGYVKYYADPGAKGPCIQVWTGKDGAESTSIDVVNFESAHAVPHRNAGKEGWYKSVKQQIDMAAPRTEKEILGSAYAVLRDMIEAREAARRAREQAAQAAPAPEQEEAAPAEQAAADGQ